MVPLPLYLLLIVVLAGCFIGTIKGNSIVGMICGILSVMISYFLSKVSLNGQLVESYGGLTSTDSLVTGNYIIQNAAMGWIFMFLALISAILVIKIVFNEINYQLVSELEAEA